MRRKHWLLRRDKSTFVDWQRVKVQELSEQVRDTMQRWPMTDSLSIAARVVAAAVPCHEALNAAV